MITGMQALLETTGYNVYYARRQKESVVPAIVYKEVSHSPYGHQSGRMDLCKTRVQVTCFAKAAEKAAEMASAAEILLSFVRHEDFGVSVPLEPMIVQYDEDTGIFYVANDYLVFHKVTVGDG